MAKTLADPFLAARLTRRLPAELASRACAFVAEVEAAGPQIDPLAYEANLNTPRLQTHDRMGEPLNDLVIHPAYREMENLAYGRFGLLSMVYHPSERQVWGPQVRTVSLAGGFAFARYEQGMLCPLCMTDGAARTLDQSGDAVLRDRYVPLLSARGSDRYTGAMFLTERQGGSDVGANTCTAVRDGDTWRLYGEKWFCSNAGADLALVLARPEGALEGTRGLGLFAMPRVLPDGSRNTYMIRRLKDKLGTRSMATGEVELNGARAYLIGAPDAGWKQMANMVNLSRLYNSLAAVAIISRSWAEATAWAAERTAWGKAIAQYPMVRDTLDAMAAELDGCQALVFETISRLERVDLGVADDADRQLARILTPIIKLYTAKRAIWSVSEALEILGGNGYVEDFRLACFFRDAQVLPIWEGTTNILVLDTFRAITKHGAHEALFGLMRACLASTPARRVAERLGEHVDELESALAGLQGLEGDSWTVPARHWVFKVAPAVAACLLLGEAAVAKEADREGLVTRAERLVAMHLEGWTAIGMLGHLKREEGLRAVR